jgi:hypothetical protein
MGAIGAWFQRAFTPSDSDNQSGAQYNAAYNASQQAAAAAGIGNLTDDEAKKAGSLRAFRIGTYFTSPTGSLNTASRRGTKLIGG